MLSLSLSLWHININPTSNFQGKRFRKEIDKFYKAKPLFNDLLPYYHTTEGRELYEEFLEITKELYPQYVREMEGIADGSGRPFHEVGLHFGIGTDNHTITETIVQRPPFNITADLKLWV